jgi:MarR-like DNA-binding transcriptional regulator SgrR of sgrS sRNA
MRANNAMEPAAPARGRTAHTSLHTNGTGPFRLVSRQPDAETVLERFDAWWDRATHPLARAISQPVATDATRVAGSSTSSRRRRGRTSTGCAHRRRCVWWRRRTGACARR